jgi:hypothetical protein
MVDLDECHRVLDDWFELGQFSGLTPIRSVAEQLRVEHPEFRLTKRGAESIVKVWMDCARDLGEID